MYQVIVTAYTTDARSPTQFVNVASLVLVTCMDRLTAEHICEHAEHNPDYIKMHGVLRMLYPTCGVACGVRPAITDIMPQR